LFTDAIVVDYTSLFGGEPQTLAAEALVASWRARLGPLRATQHLLGPIAVELRDRAASAACHVPLEDRAHRARVVLSDRQHPPVG
jgi:hypothetical protein